MVISEKQANAFYFNFSGDKAAKVLKSCLKCSKKSKIKLMLRIRIIFRSQIWIRIILKIQKLQRLNIEPWRVVDANKRVFAKTCPKRSFSKLGIQIRAEQSQILITSKRRSFQIRIKGKSWIRIKVKSRISIKTMPIHNTGSNYIASWRNQAAPSNGFEISV